MGEKSVREETKFTRRFTAKLFINSTCALIMFILHFNSDKLSALRGERERERLFSHFPSLAKEMLLWLNRVGRTRNFFIFQRPAAPEKILQEAFNFRKCLWTRKKKMFFYNILLCSPLAPTLALFPASLINRSIFFKAKIAQLSLAAICQRSRELLWIYNSNSHC